MDIPTKAVALGTDRLSPDGASTATEESSSSCKSLTEQVVDVLRSVYDPEVPVNIHELGLIYDMKVTPEGAVDIKMTLTSPACPVAGSLPGEVESKLRKIPGVTSVKVELVWEPPWDKDRMSEAAQLQLGLL
jgi:FeS assembly SUF system protein